MHHSIVNGKKHRFEAGMNGHIGKPIEIPKLIETLQTMI